MNRFLGVVMILMALTMAIAPIFTDCASQGKALTLQDGRNVPMKCHWAGVAAVGAAAPLGLAGIFALRRSSKATLRQASIMGVAAGGMGILFPTALIGVCGNPMMICNMIMRPTLVAAGTLAIAASLALFVLARETTFTAMEAAA